MKKSLLLGGAAFIILILINHFIRIIPILTNLGTLVTLITIPVIELLLVILLIKLIAVANLYLKNYDHK